MIRLSSVPALSVFSGKLKKLSNKKLLVPLDFFLFDASRSHRDKSIQQGLAAGLALLGDSIAATSAHQRSKMETWTNLFEFMVDEHRFSGFLDCLPFDDGDEVEVVAKREEGDQPHACFAVARPSDRLIALRPECKMGRMALKAHSVRRVLFVSTFVAGISLWMTTGSMPLLESILWATLSWAGAALFWAFIEWRMYVEDIKVCVPLTERILASLGVDCPESVNLIRLSKQTKTGKEPPGYRWLYYRY